MNMATNYSHTLISFTFFFISIILCMSLTAEEAINGGFTVELIRRDSSESSSIFQQVNNAIRRSVKRVNPRRRRHFFPQASQHSQSQEQELVTVGVGEYLMEYSIGTPPVKFFGALDTGSDVVWTQCNPCPRDLCFNQTDPLFDPSKSKTYKNISCASKYCLAPIQNGSAQTYPCAHAGSSSSKVCDYGITYADDSFSNGVLASDTITLGSTTGLAAFPNAVFGCGHNNNLTLAARASGIVGLARGSISLVSQMGDSIEGKFAYCLVPFFLDKNSSKLSFGQNAVVSGPGTVSTPMVVFDPRQQESRYFLKLDAMSVGGKRLEFTTNAGNAIYGPKGEGNTLIDSGTSVTRLPRDFYSKLEAEVASHIKLERVKDPGQFLSLCYKSKTTYLEEAPIITVHYKGGDVTLNPVNTFIKVSNDITCFAFHHDSGDGGLIIYGSIAQFNFLVGYDLRNKLVSFKPMDCTKH